MTQLPTSDICVRLHEICTDWDGSPMHPSAEPRIIPDCRELREIAEAMGMLVVALDDATSLLVKLGAEHGPGSILEQCQQQLAKHGVAG